MYLHKRPSLLLLMPVFLLAASCAGVSYHWQHPDGLDDQARADAQAECDQLAYLEAATNPVPPFFSEHNRLHFRHGGYLFDDQYRLQRQRELFRVCMKAKGWRRIRND